LEEVTTSIFRIGEESKQIIFDLQDEVICPSEMSADFNQGARTSQKREAFIATAGGTSDPA
jgi:hypothetical protein